MNVAVESNLIGRWQTHRHVVRRRREQGVTIQKWRLEGAAHSGGGGVDVESKFDGPTGSLPHWHGLGAAAAQQGHLIGAKLLRLLHLRSNPWRSAHGLLKGSPSDGSCHRYRRSVRSGGQTNQSRAARNPDITTNFRSDWGLRSEPLFQDSH